MRRALLAIALGTILFSLNYAGVLSGVLAPPSGYEPAFALRNLDTPQYLTWLQAARTDVLLPNYHAPWQTEPALWQPLMLAAARSGLKPLTAYYTLHLSLYIGASWALLFAASVFCPGRQQLFALAFAACAIPFRLIGWLLASAFGFLQWKVLFVAGMLDYGYETADGLFRGGISQSPPVTAGTMSVLLAMGLLARYLQNQETRTLFYLCVVTFVSALIHPFEVFTIVAAASFPMLLEKRVWQWITLGASGALGLAPNLIMGARAEWLRDVGELIHSDFQPFWILADYGIPYVLCVYLLLIRFRMPAVQDTVLKSWLIVVPLLVLVPGIPFQIHLLDGYAYCTGFLLVRRLACDPQILPLIQRHRRYAQAGFAALLVLSATCLLVFYSQVWRDGRRAEPEWLVNAVSPAGQQELLDWIAANTARETLVLSPPDLAPWIATIPRHSFASHDFFSISFAKQRKLADRFYGAEAMQAEILDAYGVGLAIIPVDNPTVGRMPTNSFRKEIGRWRVFALDGNTLKPYPAGGVLDPAVPRSLRHRILESLSSP